MAKPSAPSQTGTFGALANRNYRLFLLGQLVSQSGTWMQRIAQSWLVLELTESPVALGTVTALQFLPILLLSLIAGAVADRYPKRAALALIQAVGLIQALFLAVLVGSGAVQLWQVYTLALVQGVASALEQPLRHAFPTELVGRDLLTNAVALNSAVFNAGRVLGPALGGFVVAGLGLAGAFLLNSASYLAVLVALGLMRVEQTWSGPAAAQGKMVQQLAEACRYAAQRPQIVFSLGTLACLGIFGFNYSTFLPLLARYALDLGPSGYGLLSAALGVGAMAGALIMARFGQPTLVGQAALGLAFGSLLAAVGLSSAFLPSLALLVLLGSAGVAFTTTTNSGLQLRVPETMRGRVMGIYSLLLAGMTPPGAAITGALADVLGIRAALLIEAGVCLAGVLAGLVWLRRHAWSDAASRGAARVPLHSESAQDTERP